mmetsp:Transcript_17377/g.12417  ORF Transcript_17377/g.12417 Transcript_17377/m.12417 type:complete len:197 (+) Transcript_17377:245-835(+)
METVNGNFVTVIISGTTIFAMVTLTLRHWTKTAWHNYALPDNLQQQVYKYKVFDAVQQRDDKRFFISFKYLLEMLILCLHPIPYLDFVFSIRCVDITSANSTYIHVPYTLGQILLACMFARLYFCFRAIFNYSMFTDLYAKRLCESYGFTANVRFAMKCFLIKHPVTTVTVVLVSSVVVLAYILRIFEAPYYHAIN